MAHLPDTKALDFDLTNGWLTVWFNSPEKDRNALTQGRCDDLSALCDVLADSRDIRGVTFRGRGSVFCAGGDLKSFKQAVSGDAKRNDTLEMSREAGALYSAINALPQITVMAIEGPCVAGGLGIASCGDIIVAETDVKFSLTEVRIGLSPAQIAPFVSARIGISNMRRLALTGATFSAAEAMKIGLADQVVSGSSAMDESVAVIIKQASSCAPGAVAATKALLLDINTSNRQAQIENAAQIFTNCMFSDEGREGLTAFVEKRKPDWQSVHKEAS